MPQLAYTLDAPPEPFNVQRCAGTTEQVYAAVAITVAWHGAAPSVIAAGTVAGPGAVDTSADLYLIVATVGSAALTLVTLADALTTGLDTILPGAQWGIVGELDAEGVRTHQQTMDALLAGGPLGGAEGDLWRFHNGSWTRLPIGPANDVLFSNGTDPLWATAAAVVAAGLPAGAEGDILIFKLGQWVVLHRRANGDVLTLIDGYPAWEPFSALPGTPVTTTVGGTAAGLGALYDARGGEPAGWQNPGFVPTGWTPSVAFGGRVDGDTSPDPPYPDTSYITGLPATDTFPYLYIQQIPIPAATQAADGFSLGLKVHDHVHSAFINGTDISDAFDQGVYDHLVAVPDGALTPGGSCYLALRLSNDAGAALVDAALLAAAPASGGGSSGGSGGGGGGGGGGGSPVTIQSGSAPIVQLDLMHGQTFNDPPPAGWYLSGFDDSGWIAAVVDASTLDTPPWPGAVPYWPGAGYPNKEVLYRMHFTLGAGAITGASLDLFADSYVVAAYVNGEAVTSGALSFDWSHPPPAVQSVRLDPGVFRPGQDNVLAIYARDDVDHAGTPLNAGTISFQIVMGGTGSTGAPGLLTIEKDGVAICTVSTINFETPAGVPTGTLSVTYDAANNRANVKYS